MLLPVAGAMTGNLLRRAEYVLGLDGSEFG